jgi:DNA-binding SARP family transcriptional activator
MEFLVLGRLETRDGTGALLVPATRKQRVLLAALLLHANRPVGRDRLVDLLWGVAPPRSAVANLYTYVAQLRKLLATTLPRTGPDTGRADRDGPLRLRAECGGYALSVTPDELDLLRFERLVEQGCQALTAGRHAAAAERLTRAVGLWRGRPLEDLPVPDELLPALARLEEQRLAAVEDCVEARLALGRHAELAAEVRALTEAHPLRERLWAQRMLAEYRAGRQSDALASYRQLYRILDHQVGVRPGEPVQRLHQQILTADPALNRPPSSAVVLGHDRAPRESRSMPRRAAGADQSAGPAARWHLAAPHQLPLDVRGFAGRDNELAQLDRILQAVDQQPTAAVICAVSGTAGVGKTTLAVHWAHRVSDQFPDGQLFVNLRGFGPGGRMMTPAEAMRGFLDTLGVPPKHMPSTLDGQVALYRGLLAGKRVLVVLDNARDADQVRPLLPANSTALALVTSRNQLTSLVAVDGAHLLTLDILSAIDSRELLARRVGTSRVAAEPDAVEAVINACARLPLALAIAAARAQQTSFTLAALAAELGMTGGRLDVLDAGDLAGQVRTVFSWSYTTLSPQAARQFRLLGLHPGPDISVPAAASLAGHPRPLARRLLTELARANLIVEHTPGRYALHDLLRLYASDMAHTHDSDTERHAALRRLLDHYLHTAHAADRHLYPHRDPIHLPLAPAGQGVLPERFPDHPAGMAWLTAEHAVLLAALRQAADARFDTHAWQLAWALNTFLDRRGHWHDLAAAWQTALPTAVRVGDPIAEAEVHRRLGHAHTQLGRHDEAHAHLRQALDRFTSAGDQAGQADTYGNLAVLAQWRNCPEKAIDHGHQALNLYRSTDQRHGQGRALNLIGFSHALLGNHAAALSYCLPALALFQELSHQVGETITWDSLGYAHQGAGHYAQAANCYRRAHTLYHGLGDRYYESASLIRLGDTHRLAGHPAAAKAAWHQALDILTDLSHPDADTVRAKLRDLDPLTVTGPDAPD